MLRSSLSEARRLFAPSQQPFSQESDEVRQRRRVLVGFVLVAGAVLLGFALATPRGADSFYAFTLVLPVVWACGAWLTGPLHLGRRGESRGTGTAVALGVASFAVFVVGDQIFRLVPVLADQVHDILARADADPTWVVLSVAVLNGIGEELFFRGAVYSAFGRHRPALWSTVVYVIVTGFTANAALVVAAVVMGTLFALERRATRGVLAPVLTHVVWSVLMVVALPR